MKNVISLIVLVISLWSNHVIAKCEDRDFSHRSECERFTLMDDTSQQAHFWAGAALTTLGTLGLEKAGMKPFPATLTALAVTMAIGVVKENCIDAYASRNGVLSMWAGGFVAAPLVFTLTF